MMTRKDYKAIAALVVKHRNKNSCRNGDLALRWFAEDLAIYLKQNNPHFDCSRFLAACGIQS